MNFHRFSSDKEEDYDDDDDESDEDDKKRSPLLTFTDTLLGTLINNHV